VSVIGAIHRATSLSLTELAARERLSLATVSKVVSALELDDMVQRGRDPRDGRVCYVALTGRCEKWIEDNRRRRDSLIVSRMARLNTDDRRALIAAIPALERLVEMDD
jgi:DNA-binding MarR family transcriptional regulator